MALLFLGGVAGVLGFLLAIATAESRGRVALLVALGLCLALAWMLVAYFSASPASDQSPGCSDCYVYLGRWWEPGLAVFIIGANFAAWVIGVLAGSGVRAVGRRRPRI